MTVAGREEREDREEARTDLNVNDQTIADVSMVQFCDDVHKGYQAISSGPVSRIVH